MLVQREEEEKCDVTDSRGEETDVTAIGAGPGGPTIQSEHPHVKASAASSVPPHHRSIDAVILHIKHSVTHTHTHGEGGP